MKFYTHAHLHRGRILVRGYEYGQRFQRKEKYEPYLFVPARQNWDGTYKSIHGDNLNKIEFGSIKDARDFSRSYQDISNFDIYGTTDYLYAYLYDTYKSPDFNIDLISIGYLDIETDKQAGGIDPSNPNAPITAITLRKNNKSVIFGYKDYTPHKEDIIYHKCKDELELLRGFLNVWENFDLDVITGWNVEFFDIPYLVNRITNLLGPDNAARLSPWGLMEEHTIIIRGRENQSYIPLGISILDYQHIYKKFCFSNSEDWKLNTIAHKELKEKKIDYSEFENLFELYEKDFQKFIEYNYHDVDLVNRLEEKLGYIELVLYLAYDAKVNYNDTLATVKPWDVIIHNYLMDQNICVHPKKVKHMDRELVGGYVKEVNPGMYNWVVSFDFDSLYPHIIMLLNIGPDTYAGKGQYPGWNIDLALAGNINNVLQGQPENLARGANLTLFRKHKQSFLSKLMETKYNDRKEFKDKSKEYKQLARDEKDPAKKKEYENLEAKYNGLQLARKIQLNSAYGALSNLWFRWFDLDCAEAITMTGQLATRHVERAVNNYLNKTLEGICEPKDRVIASDTDSIYITLDDLVNELYNDDVPISTKIDFVDKVAKTKLQEVINNACKELYSYLRVDKEALKMKRETIANKGLWVAAKNYMLNAWDIEGYRFEEPELKVTGIKAVMPSTPGIVREAMKETFKIMMNEGESKLHEYIANFRTEFEGKPFDIIAMPRGVNALEKYSDSATVYKPSTPIHVRASLVYNKMLKDYNLTNDYEYIYSGDKIKFGYLKVPNPAKENVIAILNDLPSEFNLDRYIDYERQFNKTYLSPLTDILSVIGWHTEKRSTLEGFF